MKLSLCFLAIFSIALSLTTSAKVPSLQENSLGYDVVDKQSGKPTAVVEDVVVAGAVDGVDDADDEDGDDIDYETEIDGIKLKWLSRQEIDQLMDDEDKIISAELDLLVTKKELALSYKAGANLVVRRRKRWIPLAAAAGRVLFAAGRALFSGSRATRLTTSGRRITRQYDRAGSFSRANRDFDRFNPSGVKSFNGKVSGRTGTIGNGHKITVRDGSSSGRSTLEIRSSRPNGREFVRKFRYDK